MKYFINRYSEEQDAFFIVNEQGEQLTGVMASAEAQELIKKWSKMDDEGQTLVSFLRTDQGHNMWDSPEVHLILDGKTIFQLRYNYEIVQDDIGLIDQVTSSFTDKVYKYKVDRAYKHKGVNYILLEEIV